MKHFLLLLTLLFFCCQEQPDYDIVLTNAVIYDGSGQEPYLGDIAINGDTIAKIGEPKTLHGRNDIDVAGKAVAPGFINMLSWANVSLLEDGRSQSDIRQGVTLEVLGEGRSMGPLNASMKEEMQNDQGDITFDVSWTTLGEYLQHLEDKGISTNVASFVGNGTLRQYVIGYENRPATKEELQEMKNLAAVAMEEGAVGLSSSLLYAPSMYADTEELIELSKVASDYNGMYISHIRNEGDKLLESIDELIRISKEADLPSEVYHLKASQKKNWPKMDLAIAKIDSARNAGLVITADIYTYNASSTGLHVQLPDWAREGGIDAMLKRLAVPENRSKAIEELEFRNAPETIMLVGFKMDSLWKYTGKYIPELAKEWGMTNEETVVDLITKDQSRVQVVYFSMSEENIAKKVAIPWVSFCSDAGSYTNEGVFIEQSTHPRGYGSFIRVLGKFARDEGVITLQEGIRKLTSLPASNLKLKKRGSLTVGNFADIVVFEPNTVTDKATFTDPHQYAEGVQHVFVNGIQVLDNGEHTGAHAGRFVKGPGYKTN
ncbi:N-acyl-D-amino-acid deacylase family protein [Maribacter aestuarii]|uniref:N-acyl-D-amino-acid deacylase family protein n=1 Tax=Maribacter aestuarii TaxID=1130723 RepID=UPI00248D121C|nr:D-aminoacylase [Maribacter aestuarii]